ncbi:3-deoxy-manno-octulosonate cytidylyltransferase [Caulobacter sp. FWC2]|uniref:3-deoxy-manno-octulosonate cytidylyltransferase n=1 Tax=Caulobacter sp. FWC2 TaxID=69664 RepID=UPI000C14B400|nr:3-deoxy-manno-octulosonate cytidylyltransferase [Caulobacter sp. FWC2]PIB90721.1 3-deoxy-manno-octulosonate cytidylyltransferase [Caulobacter sp. FWC2]
MNPLILIPARMAAARLPGKPLADIGGVPMIVRVLRQALKADIGPVAVAAGDAEIVEAVQQAGGIAVLTDPGLPSGSDRIQAALAQLDPGFEHDVVINLQGDMPFVDPAVLSDCARILKEFNDADIATVVAPEASIADRANPDVVKAVLAMEDDGQSGRALYFTRSTLYGDGPVWRHIGIYGYRREALVVFNDAAPSALEKREKLEQLRALELGLTIRAAVATSAPISVDNPSDLEAARKQAQETA